MREPVNGVERYCEPVAAVKANPVRPIRFGLNGFDSITPDGCQPHRAVACPGSEDDSRGPVPVTRPQEVPGKARRLPWTTTSL